MLEQQTNNEHQIHIDVLPTDKFKTTLITFKFMAPLEYETITARSLLSKLLIRATKNSPRIKHLVNIYLNYMVHTYIVLSQNLKINTLSLSR